MSDKQSKTNFEAWVAKAAQRLEDKRVPRKRRLYNPSLDEEITIRSLTTREIADVMDSDDTDSLRQDKRAVYTAVVEPDLHALAKQLQEAGQIVDPMDVTDIFEQHERAEIVLQVMERSAASPATPSVWWTPQKTDCP